MEIYGSNVYRILWVLIEHLIYDDGPVTVSNESKLVNQPPLRLLGGGFFAAPQQWLLLLLLLLWVGDVG